MANVTNYNIELRDKNGSLKAYLTPYVTKLNWTWNRIGGCGNCQIEIKKPYRDISFEARDDIQIRIKSGSTSKLVYRGYISESIPKMQINQKITLDVNGYFELLKKIIVHSSGDTRTYATDTIANIADDIADTFIVPNSPITISGALTAGDFTVDSIQFFCTVENALRTLAEIQGDIEYGVDEDLVLYWNKQSDTINHKFFVGNNVDNFERRINWKNLVNKIYLVGGEVNDLKYKKTGENKDSQTLYWLNEEIVSNSSILTDEVALKYINAILSRKASPEYILRGSVLNTDIRMEDTIPMGKLVFYDAEYDKTTQEYIIGEAVDGGDDITIGELIDGGSNIFIGGVYSAQIESIFYTPSDTAGRFNIDIQLGDTTVELAAKLKQLELIAASQTQY